MTTWSRWIGCALVVMSTNACTAADDAAASAGSAEDGAPGGPGEQDGVAEPFARACVRLHDECAPVCDNVFVECYDDVATCTEQWTRDYLADFDDPIVDPDLLATCAAQVDAQACTDLEPDTVECEFAIVETCRDDDDGFGNVASPYTAAPVELGVPFTVHLCAGVEEFFAISLDADTELELVQDEDAPHVFADLVTLSTTSGGDTVMTRGSLGGSITQAGAYFVAFYSSDAVEITLTIAPQT